MFKRLQYAEWQDILPILAFLISFLLFLLIIIRALRMRRERAEKMANLPLASEENRATKSTDHEP